MIKLEDIGSLTDFARNTKTHLKRLKRTGRPELLTVNGKLRWSCRVPQRISDWSSRWRSPPANNTKENNDETSFALIRLPDSLVEPVGVCAGGAAEPDAYRNRPAGPSSDCPDKRQVLCGHRRTGTPHEQYPQSQGEQGYLDPARCGAEHAVSGSRAFRPYRQLRLVAERQPADPEPTEPAAQAKPAADEEKHIAATEEERTAALAKAAQNPVADLISFPLQNNTNFGVGPYDRDQNVLNIQPVIPLHISQKWNLITRTILPVVWQPDASQPTG
jgi:hypothetical protein